MRKLLLLMIPLLILVGCSNSTVEQSESDKVKDNPLSDDADVETKEEQEPEGNADTNEEQGNGSVSAQEEKVVTKAEYVRKLAVVEASLAAQREIIETGTQVDMEEAAGEMYKAWDNTLNELYGILQSQLSDEVMQTLREEQRNWIVLRDEVAEAEAANYKGGSMESFAYTSKLMEMTKNRCIELVEMYM
ncbi:DUF1311 domain-containing protein [Ornithinibacillus sp. BX22]|uniref:DUF1311 domain-containing protein n=1 Tax=Ornithinibacillus hominis TaxID=2763055 RepID=A0A923L7T9_9BACI|nr:lysozyme inhibitor LprI family protein [Ornithinibacillus hominis]MBC5638115.1 DUF1311 domain-containing protein [Ornithinibacillus hominis]